jgi:hypothetical protein
MRITSREDIHTIMQVPILPATKKRRMCVGRLVRTHTNYANYEAINSSDTSLPALFLE